MARQRRNVSMSTRIHQLPHDLVFGTPGRRSASPSCESEFNSRVAKPRKSTAITHACAKPPLYTGGGGAPTETHRIARAIVRSERPFIFLD